MTPDNRTTPYDVVPYPSRAFAFSHPDHLYALARVHGLQPTVPGHSRVLELGCGDGGNLLPMAYGLRDAEFVGLDYAATALTAARTQADALGLGNIRFVEADLKDTLPDLGQFDYIIVHGLLSWVSPTVQGTILQLLRSRLNNGGVAFVSYNALPGWWFNIALRDLLRFHVARLADHHDQLHAARELLTLLVDTTPPVHDLNAQAQQQLARKLLDADDAYLFHDYLAEYNTPLYQGSFALMLAAHGLRDLGEAPPARRDWQPNAAQRAVLGSDIDDASRLMQYQDFMRHRTLRTAVVCQSSAPRRPPDAASLADLCVGSALQPLDDDLDVLGLTPAVFATPNGDTLTTDQPLLKAALLFLGSLWPQVLPFAMLVQELGDVLEQRPDADETAALQAALLDVGLAGNNRVELRPNPIARLATSVGNTPHACATARLAAAHGDSAPNLRHEVVPLGERDRQLLPLLDGSHDTAALRRALPALDPTWLDARLTQYRQWALLEDDP